MCIPTNSSFVISLIKDDLINSKLVYTLCDAGLNAVDYYLQLSKTIFQLMGYDSDEYADEVFRRYFILSQKVKFISIKDGHHTLDPLANELYNLLRQKAPKQQMR
jgi:hypothetical protein